ncbi:MAG: hypothetical protein D6772_17130 [Bacteroidetes bacterium]|nr:MAG: hypothetical protein D6772_17130 [Bacteroidota bacterium]
MDFLRIGILSLICPSLLAQLAFTEITASSGFVHTESCEGISIGDFNNDGYEDIYLPYRNKPNQLWQNLGDGTFRELAREAGLTIGQSPESRTAIWGDIDNDGYLDLYVGNRQRPDKLFHNEGNGTFTDISSSAGILQLGNPLSVNMADVNNDGYLDIYISNFSSQNVLFLNDGDLTFTNYTLQSGALDIGLAMGSIFFDYDRDGDADLYLTHDGNQPNILYQNDGTGHFTQVAAATGTNTTSFAMGVDVGDIDNDGWLDIHIANLYPNFLLHCQGDGTFTEIAHTAGVADAGMGWGTTFLDYDNDGWLDLYVANEYQFSPFRNVLFRNQGDLTFAPIDEADPVCNELASYGTVSFDYNLDGQPDLAVANRAEGQGFQLFENQQESGNWLIFKLIGVESNRQAIGAKIELWDNLGRHHYDELTAGNGWLSQNSQLFHFGLGQATSLDSILVYWPSGLVQVLAPIPSNHIYTLIEGREPTPGISFDIPDVVSTNTSTGLLPPDWKLFPNPAQDWVQIHLIAPTYAQQQVHLYSSLGQLLWTETLRGLPGQDLYHRLDLKELNLASGLYTLRWSDGIHHSCRRLVIH